MRMKRQCVRAVATIVVGLCLCAASRAQNPAGGETKPKMMAKDADPGWEVVTVKPNAPNATSDHAGVHGPHVTLENETVEILILFGYNVQKNQIDGAPGWVKTERWTVDGLADVDGEPDVKQLQSLVRKLLAERFGLKLRREQREMPVFALTVAKGGPKVTPSKSDPDRLPNQHGNRGVGWQMYQYTNTSMPELALELLSSVDRPIVDQTGLQGRYDFQLKWLTDDSHASDPDAPPGLFTAIQEQLGLKLEPMKAPAEVLVVDKVERPGAN
jgi:uncharacterized protein (TIGR03435 family)